MLNGEQQGGFWLTQSAGHQALNLGGGQAWNGGYWCDTGKSSRSCKLGGEGERGGRGGRGGGQEGVVGGVRPEGVAWRLLGCCCTWARRTVDPTRWQ